MTSAAVQGRDNTLVTSVALTRRDFAILGAVRNGRTELVVGSEPDMLVDGLNLCDQPAAHRLVHAGLIAPAHQAVHGARVPAVLTDQGEIAWSWTRDHHAALVAVA
ncbi:hypothetical protein [Amycolatopsis sp. NBC_01286]|uniref:hypothetical protein n=1 Tax=Amycolatopsis sp. NBC_01286 TaxID=2903560 RepID=UPI002E12F5F5|nr:hypothetical protein OG570_48185 [Amycolatopsis sp. NBC_01286]